MSYSVEIAFTHEIDTDFVSKAIEFGEKVGFSHTLCFFIDTDGKRKIFHNRKGGPQVDEKLDYLKTHKVIESFEVPLSLGQGWLSGYVKARCESGVSYSWKQYINHGIRIACSIFGIENPWQPIKNGGREGVCSEEMCLLVLLSDIPEKLALQSYVDTISPKQLRDWLAVHAKRLC